MTTQERFVGIDVGTETVKLVELTRTPSGLEWTRSQLVEHHKQPGEALLRALASWSWKSVRSASVVGRASRLVNLPRVPTKQAHGAAFRRLHPETAGTVVSIGSHGFSVLELRDSGVDVYRENSRCSQGTGNFLRQLVERFGLSIEEASAACEEVTDPAPLSGRCPVILKTDMTHLANKGDRRDRILAGLYDAVCENVSVLIKPSVSPAQVVLVGGVSRSRRVREHFRAFLESHGMKLLDLDEGTAVHFDALGAACIAAERAEAVPSLSDLLSAPIETRLERVSALSSHLPAVERLKASEPEPGRGSAGLLLGFDIGSTGSKVVALDVEERLPVWEGYVNTNGDPVGAAQSLMQQFVDSPAGALPVMGFGATGSGREIVGSLLSTCYGTERVYVLNEIAAHAEGALHFDPRVDTIFEIGGQDAKYIRLSEGRVVDAAMNEACSAGTGSFIEEQGRKFQGIESVVALGEEALQAESGVSLGQHCSVFMAEIIDEAVAAGIETPPIVAGIYASIIQNYLNRVKGSRSVGQVVFCQGMPFSSDALAAAVARETGSRVIVPPNPGTVGALGIALLAHKALALAEAMDAKRFLDASVERRDTFVCKSKKGCGEPGNLCRIDRIATRVTGKQQKFTWGGSCSLWDKGTGRTKLPDLAPDPFREREALVDELVGGALVSAEPANGHGKQPSGSKAHEASSNGNGASRAARGNGTGNGAERAREPAPARRNGRPRRQRIAVTDEFQLKELFPFFVTFLDELGFEVVRVDSEGQRTLKRGIEGANVPFCAPMQLYHGLVSRMAEHDVDLLFVPMLREMPRSADEVHSVACPIVQGSPDVLTLNLSDSPVRVVSPVIDFGEGNYESQAFLESCQKAAAALGVFTIRWWRAYQKAKDVQLAFKARCREIGERALEFCSERGVIPVVVLGRPYTIYNGVLNSHVPPLLREQGAMAIPVDCYPIDDQVPSIHGVYWGHGQRNLRAAHQIRRSQGVYSIWCSNYSCGPDSFNLHFYAYAMAGKPFAVIETDGHSGDAGTKTRVEAFLHCVREDQAAERRREGRVNDMANVARDGHDLGQIRRRREHVIFPRMGDGAETVAACLRGIGVPAETLPMADREALKLGRRHTSGKECVPMCITLGSLLQRLERADEDEKFAFFMPTADGPCRFGVYNVLHRIVLERLGYQDRVKIWSPVDSDYFAGLPAGFTALVVTGFAAFDALQQALFDTRPVERRPGAAVAIHDKYQAALLARIEQAGGEDLSLPAALLQVASGRLFGIASLLEDAARELARVKGPGDLPTVMVVGEIYVRLDPFANDFVIEKLEERGLRVRFAPFSEWLEYTDHVSQVRGFRDYFGARLSTLVQRRIQNRAYSIMADRLGWPRRTTVTDTLEAAQGYVREDLCGEAVLTVGGPVHEWRHGLIDGVVSVGPLECMPNKIAEAQFFHVAEREGLPSLTIPVNGDVVDPVVIDDFAYEVHSRRRGGSAPAKRRRRLPVVSGPRAT